MSERARCLRLLIVAQAPLIRLRLRQALGAEGSMQLLDQVADAAEGVRLALELRPDLILCDTPIAEDPALTSLFAQRREGGMVRLVLLTDEAGEARRRYPVPLVALLPLDLPPAELMAYLWTLVDTRADGDATSDLPRPASGAPIPREATIDSRTPPHPARRATDRAWSPTRAGRGADPSAPLHTAAEPHAAGLSVPAASASAGAARRPEAPEAAPKPCVELVERPALDRAIGSLIAEYYPLSAAVVELCYAPCSVVPTDATTRNRLTRRLEQMLRQSIRSSDLLCQIDSLTYVALLPGMLATQHPMFRERLLGALSAVPFAQYAYGLQLLPAIGLSSWEPGESRPDVLGQARRAANREREALLRQELPAASW